jgi:integrase
VKVKKTSKGDARILAWLGKVRMPDGSTFGDRTVADVTLDDCDHVMTTLPKSVETPATRRHYAQSLRKLITYAVYPLRLLATHPIPKGWLPKMGSSKAKAWVYPAEDLALMQCREVPLERRVFFGLLVREGFRTSEAVALTWPDVDLERGVVRLDVNKTDDPRSWALGEDVTRALLAWKDLREAKAKRSPKVFPPSMLAGYRANRLAAWLREGLALAGAKRPELTESKAKVGRIRLRAHDLRGSFVTLALAVGRTEAWVTDRTGHKSSSMIYRYKRASRQAEELGLGWFAPLDEAIPELSPKPRQGANRVQTRGRSGRQASRGGPRNLGQSALRNRRGMPCVHLKSAARKGVRVRPPKGPLFYRCFWGVSQPKCRNGSETPRGHSGRQGREGLAESLAQANRGTSGAFAGRWSRRARRA